MLRHFLYLDNALTAEFLSQAEGGIYDEEAIHSRIQRGRKAGGKVGAGPLGGELGGSRSAEDEAARTVRQTPESQFDRLVSTLNTAEDILLLDSDDLAPEIKRGQIVEADVSMAMPTFVRMLMLAHNLVPVMELFQSTGFVPELDENAKAGLAGALVLGQVIQTLPIVCTLVNGSFKLVMQLRPEFARVTAAELEGEATVLAKVRRRLAAGERHNTVQFLANQGALPADLRAEFEKSMEGSEMDEDMFVSGPAVLATPVAVYR